MKRITKIRVAVGAIVCGVCFAIVYSTCSLNNQAYATSSTNYNSTVVKKTLLQGVHRCYTNGAIKSKVDKISTFTSFTSLVIGGTSGTYIALPSGLTNITDNNISCSGLFFGDATGIGTEGGTFEGLFRLAGRSASATTKEAKQTLLEGMGYNQDNNSSAVMNQKCIAFNYKQKQQYISQPSTVTTDQICAQIGSDGKITSLSVNMSTATYGVKSEVSFFKVTNDGKISVPIAPVVTEYYDGYTDRKETVTSLGVGSTWSDFSTDLRSTLSKRGAFTYEQKFYDGSSVTYDYSFEGNSTAGNYDEDTVGDVSYSFNNPRLASTRAIRYLSNNSISDWQSLGFSDAEKIALLSMSLKEYFYAGVSDVSSYWVCNVSDWADYGSFPSSHAIKVSPNGSLSANCRINPSLVKNSGTIYGFSGNFFDSAGGTKLNLVATIAEINRLAGDVPDDVDQVPIDPGVSGGTTGGENGGNNGGSNGGSDSDGDVGMLDGCFTNAGVLGWIMCPVVRLLEGAVDGIYNVVIQDSFLQVGASTVTSPATREAWGKFQSFSNIIFAIVLVIVILSQVTGVGLSNYNVKKILPRLIITIVLVNLSFILCSIAVDLSNILGVELNKMFENFYVPTKAFGDINPGTFVKNTVTSLLGGGALLFGAVTIIEAATMKGLWSLLMLPIFFAILGVVIGILFFFIVLGVRQAAIIILLVVSPLAVICYALPNTQKVFDRWLKAFSSLLVVFPICGLMMGGGNFVSRLLLNAASEGEGFMFYFVAMLMPVIPFFFIPAVVKNSLSALGNLGMKISQMGSRVGSGIVRGMRGTEWARDLQRQNLMNYTDSAAGRLERRREQRGRLTERQQRRLNRLNSRYNRMAYEDIRAGGVDQRLTPGSAQRSAEEQAARTARENTDISGRQDLYRGGSMASIIAGHTDPVNGQNGDELEDELGAYMDRIITGQDADGNALSDEEINDSVMNAQALINTLGDQGTSGARARIEQSFARAMNRHQAIFGDPDQRGRLSRNFGSLASRTNAKYGKDFKKDSPGAAAMLGDIAQGDFSRAGSFTASGRTDKRGNAILRSSHYGGMGAGVSGMSTEDFSKLKGYGAHNILEGIRAGQINGSDARAAARMADEVLNSGVYTPDSDVRDVLEQIRTAGYSAGGAINGRSAGSLALSGASTGALESVVSDVSSIADSAAWGSLSAAEQNNYRQLFDNIRETLDNDTLSAANADQLQQALKIAHDRGFTDASGSVIGAFSGTPHLKIDHSAPQSIVVPPVPQGWTEGGMWTGGGSGPSKQQEIAYQEWAKIKARADMQNNGGNP